MTEILSETTLEDETFGIEEKKVRFKVRIEPQAGEAEETILLEQSYSLDTPTELMPREGKHFVFYKETLADGAHAYTLIDVQRLNHVRWVALLVLFLLLIFGRWYGLKALLIGGGMLVIFLLLHTLHVPWLLNSILSFAAVAAFSALLTFGPGLRLTASISACLASGALTLILIWLGSWLGVSSVSVLLKNGLILQMIAGLSHIAITTVTAIHVSRRNEPGLGRKALFQKGLHGGRGALEVVTTLYLVMTLGQILSSAYGQGHQPGLLQMEPILTEMASLLFMLIGFACSVPVSAVIASRMLQSKVR
ncbi:MAG: hypothetical protein IGS03_07095 [Candidatus Sericytochromatia bacterium]|nr:hypothetical protein [Candidatus Sericytochromatia bacterium]